jgi:hypothetical protein
MCSRSCHIIYKKILFQKFAFLGHVLFETYSTFKKVLSFHLQQNVQKECNILSRRRSRSQKHFSVTIVCHGLGQFNICIFLLDLYFIMCTDFYMMVSFAQFKFRLGFI